MKLDLLNSVRKEYPQQQRSWLCCCTECHLTELDTPVGNKDSTHGSKRWANKLSTGSITMSFSRATYLAENGVLVINDLALFVRIRNTVDSGHRKDCKNYYKFSTNHLLISLWWQITHFWVISLLKLLKMKPFDSFTPDLGMKVGRLYIKLDRTISSFPNCITPSVMISDQIDRNPEH